jgi:hypothetical protein
MLFPPYDRERLLSAIDDDIAENSVDIDKMSQTIQSIDTKENSSSKTIKESDIKAIDDMIELLSTADDIADDIADDDNQEFDSDFDFIS